MRFLPVLLLVLILLALLGEAKAGVTKKPTGKKSVKKTPAKKTTPKKTTPKIVKSPSLKPSVSSKPAPVISIPPGVGSRPVKPGYPAGIFVELNANRQPVAYLDTALVNYNISIDVIPGNRRTWFKSYLPNNAYLIIGSPGYPADSGITRSFYDVELRNWPFKSSRNTLRYIMNWPHVFIGNTAGAVRVINPDNCEKGPCHHIAVSVMNTKMLNVSVPPTINIDGVLINSTLTVNASHIEIPSIPNYKFELAFFVQFELIDLTKLPKSPPPLPPSKSMMPSLPPVTTRGAGGMESGAPAISKVPLPPGTTPVMMTGLAGDAGGPGGKKSKSPKRSKRRGRGGQLAARGGQRAARGGQRAGRRGRGGR